MAEENLLNKNQRGLDYWDYWAHFSTGANSIFQAGAAAVLCPVLAHPDCEAVLDGE